jgi:predicted MFS family arabinose efflux permease
MESDRRRESPFKKMLSHPRRRIAHAFLSDREFSLMLAAGFVSGIATGINNSVFSNFLHEVYHLTEMQRGFVEFPREFPGVMVIFLFAVLSFLGSTRLAALSMVLSCLGMLGLGLFSPSFPVMLIWMFVLNMGIHIFLPLVPGMGMELSHRENYGIRLGRYSAYNLAATIIGYVIIWLGFDYLSLTYTAAFTIAAVCYFAAAVLLMYMKPMPKVKKQRLVFKKKYLLFYALSVVNGARKQIFLTFAPWVLIKIYGVDAPKIAIYGIIVAVVSIGTRTIIGKAIDKLGEKVVLSAEAVLLVVLCMGYAFAADIFPTSVALIITAACYIADNSLAAVEMARSTYVKKISDDAADVIPTLSTGVSLDHIVSMSIPIFGGMLWLALGYQLVFIFASAIAVINLVLSLRIRIKQH